MKGFDDVDTPEEGVCKKRKTLKDAIQYGKVHFLPGEKGKWSTENIDRKTDEEVEKIIQHVHATGRYKSKCEMTGRAMGTHAC